MFNFHTQKKSDCFLEVTQQVVELTLKKIVKISVFQEIPEGFGKVFCF